MKQAHHTGSAPAKTPTTANAGRTVRRARLEAILLEASSMSEATDHIAAKLVKIGLLDLEKIQLEMLRKFPDPSGEWKRMQQLLNRLVRTVEQSLAQHRMLYDFTHPRTTDANCNATDSLYKELSDGIHSMVTEYRIWAYMFRHLKTTARSMIEGTSIPKEIEAQILTDLATKDHLNVELSHELFYWSAYWKHLPVIEAGIFYDTDKAFRQLVSIADDDRGDSGSLPGESPSTITAETAMRCIEQAREILDMVPGNEDADKGNILDLLRLANDDIVNTCARLLR